MGLERLLVELRLFLSRHIHDGSHQSDRPARRITQTPAARQQPAPAAVCMAHAILAFEARRAPLEVLPQPLFETGLVVGVYVGLRAPLGPRFDHGFRALAAQQLHLRGEEQPVGGDIPVPVPLVRAFHRKGIALLAFAQRLFTGRRPPYLAKERGNGQCAEQHDDECAHADADRLIAPRLECRRRLSGDGDPQARGPDRRHGDEILGAIDRIDHPGGR